MAQAVLGGIMTAFCDMRIWGI